MKSNTGALLTKIAAIINFVTAGILILIGISFSIFISPATIFAEKTFQNKELLIKTLTSYPSLFFLIFLFIAIIILIIGLLQLMASNKMKSSKTVKNGSIWAIVIGALTITQLTGILCLIGGILGVIDSEK
jgi:hypothetical protein